MIGSLIRWLRFKALMLKGDILMWRFRRTMDRHLDGAYEELQRWGVRDDAGESDSM